MNPTDEPRGPEPEATPAEELASALLDGVASDADAADDPAVVAARAAFERVARAVAAPVPVDAEQRERAIAAALDALPAATPAPAPVDEVARRRQARRRLTIAGIAAGVLAVVGLGLVAFDGGGSTGDDDTAAVATDDAFEGEAGASTSAETAGGSTELAFAGDLGTFDDLDSLVAAADQVTTARTSSAASSPTADADQSVAEESAPAPATGGVAADASLPCAAPAPPPGAIQSTSTANLSGRAVTVVVVDGAQGRVVQVYDTTTCEVVATASP